MSAPPAAAPRRIAVFRALQLGDMLCAVPALRVLRQAWPQARITLIGLPWAISFVERYRHLVDDLLVFPGAPGFPEQDESGAGLEAFFTTARARRFDLAIQLHGSGGPANDMVTGLGAARLAGFCDVRDEGRAVGAGFLPWPDGLPEPLRYLALMQHLGLLPQGRAALHAHAAIEFPLHEDDQQECDEIAAAWHVDTRQAVIVHPGAQLPSRRWLPERFAQVADGLALQGWQVLLTGTMGERPLTAAVRAHMALPATDLAGVTTLGGLAALVRSVSLVVCNDTGLSHLAAALGTPSVVVACGSEVARWAPLDHARHRVVADLPACRPCQHRVCPYGHECARNVPVSTVRAVVQRQLEDHLPGGPAASRTGSPPATVSTSAMSTISTTSATPTTPTTLALATMSTMAGPLA